jgi:hypothetical protein
LNSPASYDHFISPIDNKMISLISECFKIISLQSNIECPPIEQLEFIKSTLLNLFMFSQNSDKSSFHDTYLKILSIFDKETNYSNLSEAKLVHKILQNSNFILFVYQIFHFL